MEPTTQTAKTGKKTDKIGDASIDETAIDNSKTNTSGTGKLDQYAHKDKPQHAERLSVITDINDKNNEPTEK